MLWGDRPDGVPVADLHPMRRLMPVLMPQRNSAAVYYHQQLDLTRTLPWLAEHSARTGVRTTLFHLVQFAMLQVLVQRPELHRFVSGRRLYQRKRYELSYAVKKQMDDKAEMTAVKLELLPGDTFATVIAKADAMIGQGRGERMLPAESETALATRLPVWMLGWLVALQRKLDAWNLLPAALTKHDPLYASAFLANLGSVGLDAPFHHLFEWGTVPIFVVIGRTKKAPWVNADGGLEVHDTVDLRYTYDERIADGLYCARSLEIVRRVVEQPEQAIDGG